MMIRPIWRRSKRGSASRAEVRLLPPQPTHGGRLARDLLHEAADCAAQAVVLGIERLLLRNVVVTGEPQEGRAFAVTVAERGRELVAIAGKFGRIIFRHGEKERQLRS